MQGDAVQSPRISEPGPTLGNTTQSDGIRGPAIVLLIAIVAIGAGPVSTPVETQSSLPVPAGREVTYAADIAPLLARECVGCHSAGGSGPFPLTTYAEVRERAERIVRATEEGVMPPWLPVSEPGTFAGERHLDDREIGLIRSWFDEGMPSGDLAAAASIEVEPGWDPGVPDLVVTLPTYRLQAEGRDIYRNLVVPIPVEETRWVEYVELRPGSRTAVHHARMMVDATRSSQELAAQDPDPGFDGMELLSNASNPDGHFIGWTPGKTRLPPLEGMPWRLDPGTDLVVQLHLRTSGVEQDVAATVEFHFSDEPPSREPAILVVSSMMIDIPEGATDYRVSNSFTLPVDVELLSIYPHAHYLGKELNATAVLPSGREVPLIRIPDWDFNWQDDYRFAEPISLPRGTLIVKDFSFDNSADNPNNPADSPRRVVYGSNSDDEMADLILQVLPRNAEERAELLQAQAWQHETEDMAYMAESEFSKGREAARGGDLDVALGHFQESLQYRSDHIGSLVGLAEIFIERGDGASAVLIARQGVLVSNGTNALALQALSAAHEAAGQLDEALDAAEDAQKRARAMGDRELQQALEDRIRRLKGR